MTKLRKKPVRINTDILKKYMPDHLERTLKLYQKKRWSKENFPKADPPKKQTDEEIVRQLKLWYYELDQDAKLRKKPEVSWVLNTLDEIIGCWYD